MADTIVLSRESTPALAFNPQTLLDQWESWKADMLTAGLEMKLFKNNVVVTPSTQLPALTEAVAPGYEPFEVSVLNGPFLDISGNAYMTTAEAVFTCDGGGADLCYGAYIVQGTGAAATVTFTLAGGAYTLPVITSGGSGYLVPPKVTVTGATGSGAILEAVLTDGVVTGITIVNGGTSYTTATATIESPNKLVCAGNFPQPRPLQNVTDAVTCIIELDNLAA